jgi:FtsP/CotA-like multicopper oxidase with cupredoxin domain
MKRMKCSRRDVFLQIEPVADYSPLAPLLCSRRYGRDCQFHEGHELGRIPAGEILDARVDALVYREYTDNSYTVPVTSPLVPADENEPPWDRRVPGALIWSRPGEQLRIHVRNADPYDCHSLHVHGLQYGIDSDGAWPRGIAAKDGRRSDEIRPGESWTYVFDVTDETIGAWPFHDHVHHIQANIERGLFGAIIVRDPAAPRVDHEVPMFFHVMSQTGATAFESKTLTNGQSFSQVFANAGETTGYICRIHGASMSGQVTVVSGPPTGTVNVTIQDNKFVPANVTVTAGTTVTWTNAGNNQHIVFSGGGGKQSFCLNGRAYVGNTPTIVGDSGETIRWYVMNLDVGSVWHNFHPHAMRWQLPAPPGGAGDVHALSPIEYFVADTEIPCAVRLPCELEDLQACPPDDACQVTITGDFLFHCHIEEHMMGGLAGLVRARQKVWVTDEALDRTRIHLPIGDCHGECTYVDTRRCGRPGRPSPAGGGHGPTHVAAREAQLRPGFTMNVAKHFHEMPVGRKKPQVLKLKVPAETPYDVTDAHNLGWWELLPCEAPVLAVHAVLMHTGKVLMFAGSGNDELYTTGLRGAVYDYVNGVFTMPPTPIDLFCAGQSVLPDGRVLVAGGTKDYAFTGLETTLIFDPISESWTFVQPMHHRRWYPNVITLGDGRVLASGGAGLAENEIYEPSAGWIQLAPKYDWPLYNHMQLLADGRVFYSGMRQGGSALRPGFLSTTTGVFTQLPTSSIPASMNLAFLDSAATVLLPPAQDQKVMVMGGWNGSMSTADAHVIDTDLPNPTYVATASMARKRIHVNSVILPDRTVVATGGSEVSERFATASLEAEIYDPSMGSWRTGAASQVPRMYHSIALLMPDGRVLTAGSNPERRNDELRLEIYHPPYLFRGPRPCIDHVPSTVSLGERFTVHTPHAHETRWLSLVRPMATTHSYDSDQRLVDLPFKHGRNCRLEARLPSNPNLVPPGYYMLFLVNNDGVPSVASWVRVAPKSGSVQSAHDDIHPNHG